MKRTSYNRNDPPYSLHDMNITDFEIDGDRLTIKTQSGMVKTKSPYSQVDGYSELNGIDWDFCYAYIFDGFTGNIGAFSGKKMFLKDFIENYFKDGNAGFSVMDENFGFNTLCITGYLSKKGFFGECTVEINCGEIVYCEDANEDDRSMKEIILSADGERTLYSVPADVADNLEEHCIKFATEYVWHGPNAKFLRLCGEQYVAIYDDKDFIDYLNEELYPQMRSKKIETVGSFDDGIPLKYKNIPWFNF